MKLTIVIPAYNEEDAIASIIERCLDARSYIVAHSPIDEVELAVVSDGSTDSTVEIAKRFQPDIRLVVFGSNRGYGAAIKRGFEDSNAEVVGFLDADGTCDPRFFADLSRALIEDDASVAIGSRLGPQSKMPAIRRLGNRIYATILSMLSNQRVTDSASGMRVMKANSLRRIYPLPDGLHFTPAMSARVLMDESLTIVERPMPYEERIGESKLSVIHDGIRFLRIILQMTLVWRPAKLFLPVAGLCMAVAVLLAMHPVESWLRNGSFSEDMIYRLLFCTLLGALSVTMISASVVAWNLHALVAGKDGFNFWPTLLDKLYSLRSLAVITMISLPCLVWLVGEGVFTWLTEGFVKQHWSRVVLAGLVAYTIGQLAVTILIANIIRYHAARSRWLAGRSVTALRSSAPDVQPAVAEPVNSNLHDPLTLS